MRVNPFVFGVLVLVTFMGPILAAQATGNWSVSGKVTATGEKITATGANPDEIKGWMTLGEVAVAYNLTSEDLWGQFGIPEDTDRARQIKELESERFSPDLLRTWLKARTGSQ